MRRRWLHSRGRWSIFLVPRSFFIRNVSRLEGSCPVGRSPFGPLVFHTLSDNVAAAVDGLVQMHLFLKSNPLTAGVPPLMMARRIWNEYV